MKVFGAKIGKLFQIFASVSQNSLATNDVVVESLNKHCCGQPNAFKVELKSCKVCYLTSYCKSETNS